MVTRIEAIYEDGVFRPSEPVNMSNGERVQLVVLSAGDTIELTSPANILAEIAALPLESASNGA